MSDRAEYAYDLNSKRWERDDSPRGGPFRVSKETCLNFPLRELRPADDAPTWDGSSLAAPARRPDIRGEPPGVQNVQSEIWRVCARKGAALDGHLWKATGWSFVEIKHPDEARATIEKRKITPEADAAVDRAFARYCELGGEYLLEMNGADPSRPGYPLNRGYTLGTWGGSPWNILYAEVSKKFRYGFFWHAEKVGMMPRPVTSHNLLLDSAKTSADNVAAIHAQNQALLALVAEMRAERTEGRKK